MDDAVEARILVVDDDRDMRRHLSDVLARSGYQVSCAKNGAIALEHLRLATHPDLVICDLHMPRVDGFTLLAAIRCSPDIAHTPVIFVSGFDEFKIPGLDRGANDYITKPFDSSELIARIRCHLRISRLSRKWREATCVDPLTGLLNRRGFAEHTSREINRAIRHQTSLSVVFLDVDRFKDLNDTFGHSYGDEILTQIADVLDRNLRGSDLAARWGGDEFVLVLPGSGRSSAVRVTYRIQQAVRQLADLDGFGVSAGIACLFEDVAATEADITALLVHAADAAMYRCKANRPNRRSLMAVGTQPGVDPGVTRH
jgi:diguanylate cyclase (GGDEF)-like protein